MKTSNPLLKLCGVLSDERCESGEDSSLPGVESKTEIIWIVGERKSPVSRVSIVSTKVRF